MSECDHDWKAVVTDGFGRPVVWRCMKCGAMK